MEDIETFNHDVSPAMIKRAKKMAPKGLRVVAIGKGSELWKMEDDNAIYQKRRREWEEDDTGSTPSPSLPMKRLDNAIYVDGDSPQFAGGDKDVPRTESGAAYSVLFDRA